MTIESMLVAKNRDQFDKIINFMRSLIVKNKIEADQVETTDTLEDYERYEAAYLMHDSSLSYQLNKQDMLDFGFSEIAATKYINDPKSFQTAVMSGNTLCKAFLNTLRKKRVAEYTENNSYYRQFCGLPYDKSQYIRVINNDKASDSDPETLLLHEVTLARYPLTYARLFYERDVDKIYADHDYLYLQFLEKPLTPYEIRNKEQLEICYYSPNYLSGSELQYWFECYNKARDEFMLNDYIELFETTYKAYVNVILMCVMSFAFNLYCSKMLEKFAVRDFTDSEIYDIIESNDLSELKSLNISLLRRIIDRLPDLKAYTGTDKVIDIIYDIVADSSINVKRYYLKKKYNVDAQGNTDIDKTQMYNKSVDIVFQEKTIKHGVNSTDNLDHEYNYDTVVMADDTWGGTHGMTNDQQKLAIKEEIKRKLLKANFSSVMTKYISVSKIIDLNVKMIDLSNKLGLLYQYSEQKGNILANDKIIFDGIETNALSIYAAWCILFGTINGLTDPDRIPLDETMIEGVMKLRTIDKLSIDALSVKNLVIDLGKGNYSETFKLKNVSENDKFLSDVIAENNERITSRHPLFSCYSLKKVALTPIEYKLNSCSSYTGKIENETIAYDQRRNTKQVETLTQTDANGKIRVVNLTTEYKLGGKNKTTNTVVSEDEGFDENNIATSVSTGVEVESNQDYRKVFKYDSFIEELLSASGTRKVFNYKLQPTYVYKRENLMDGQYAFDGNNVSKYTERTTWTDTNGKHRVEEKLFEYDLYSAIARLANRTVNQDPGFDISDPGLTKNFETLKTENDNFLKVYVFNNGDWELADNAWVETQMKVDNTRTIVVPARAEVDVYALFAYAATVGDYLTDEEIEQNLVTFKNASTLTISELYADYDKNYEIITAIKDKIAKSYDFAEYQLWDTMYKANMAYTTINSMFGGARNYSEYILNNSQEMYDYLDGKIAAATSPNDLRSLEEKFHKTFADYIKTLSENNAEIYTNEADVAGGEDLSQISILFRQFVSLYTQLYKSTYNISYDNAADNSLELLHSIVKDVKTFDGSEILELVDRIVADRTTMNSEDYLVLEEYVIDRVKLIYYEYLELSAGYYTEPDAEGNTEFVPDKYFKDQFKQLTNEIIALSDNIDRDQFRSSPKESVGFTYEIVGDKVK